MSVLARSAWKELPDLAVLQALAARHKTPLRLCLVMIFNVKGIFQGRWFNESCPSTNHIQFPVEKEIDPHFLCLFVLWTTVDMTDKHFRSSSEAALFGWGR